MRKRDVLVWAALVTAAARPVQAQMVFEGQTGQVTANEVARFKSYVQGLALPTTIGTTDLAYGTTGTRVESMGRLYEMTQDKALLDTMLRWTDLYLHWRNDPVTGDVDWTGQRELIWLPAENRSGAEQGIIAAKISYAAQLILQTPALWSQTVASGDPYGYGATYKQRADRYVLEMDKTEDTFLNKWFVRASDNRYFFPTDPRYDYNRPGRPAPHNQGWMFSFDKFRLAKCHEILGNATRAARYREIVQANHSWYTSEFQTRTYQGFPAYIWYYDETTNVEDTGHAQIGIQGMFYLDILGGYSSFPDRVRVGNTFRYQIYKPATDQWSGEVDGTGSLRDDMLPSYIVLSRFVPSLYSILANDQVAANKIATNVETVGYLLWAKQALFTGSWTAPRWPAGTPTPTPTSTPTLSPTPTPTPTPTVPSGGDVEVTPGSSGVSASTNDGNVPGNTVDNNLATRWSANGDGHWLKLDLGATLKVTRVRVAVYNGNTRQNRFDLQTSTDDATWTTVLGGLSSSGTTTLEEEYNVPDTDARWVRYLGHGSSDPTKATTNSVTEVSIFAQPTVVTPTPTAGPTATPTPTSMPPTYVEVSPPASAVTASTNDGNVPGNVVDNNLTTRWSANGDGQWLQLDLGSERTVGHVNVAVYNGNTRRNSFEIQVATVPGAWTTVFSGQNAGTTTAEEKFDFTDTPARWVRYLGHMNSVNAFNSVTEVSVFALP
jgi:hypothetical protein